MQLLAFMTTYISNILDLQANDIIENEDEDENANKDSTQVIYSQWKERLCTSHNFMPILALILSSSTLYTTQQSDHISAANSKDPDLEFHREVIKLSLQIISNFVYRNSSGQVRSFIEFLLTFLFN
jgi:hypothetical protein